jgi:hypothetical protein
MKIKVKYNEKSGYEEKTIVSDPFGSYTGRSEDPHEIPIQDADDL